MTSSEVLINSESFLSENPIDFILLNSTKSLGSPLLLICFSQSTISLICSKNQGSILDKLYIFLKSIFFLIASATSNILFGIVSLSFFQFVFYLNQKFCLNLKNQFPETPVPFAKTP